jgi:hypothetical protein
MVTSDISEPNPSPSHHRSQCADSSDNISRTYSVPLPKSPNKVSNPTPQSPLKQPLESPAVKSPPCRPPSRQPLAVDRTSPSSVQIALSLQLSRISSILKLPSAAPLEAHAPVLALALTAAMPVLPAPMDTGRNRLTLSSKLHPKSCACESSAPAAL